MFPISAGATADGAGIEIHIFEEAHAQELSLQIEANRRSLREWLPWLDWSNGVADTVEHIRGSRQRYEDSNGFSAGIWIAG